MLTGQPTAAAAAAAAVLAGVTKTSLLQLLSTPCTKLTDSHTFWIGHMQHGRWELGQLLSHRMLPKQSPTRPPVGVSGVIRVKSYDESAGKAKQSLHKIICHAMHSQALFYPELFCA